MPHSGFPHTAVSPIRSVAPHSSVNPNAGVATHGGVAPNGGVAHTAVSHQTRCRCRCGIAPHGSVAPHGGGPPHGGVAPYGSVAPTAVSPHAVSPIRRCRPHGVSPVTMLSPHTAVSPQRRCAHTRCPPRGCARREAHRGEGRGIRTNPLVRPTRVIRVEFAEVATDRAIDLSMSRSLRPVRKCRSLRSWQWRHIPLD